ELESQHFSVQKALKGLYESMYSKNNPTQNSLQFKWIKSKWSLNKKKDTFWQLLHRALPLGYRLVHIDPDIQHDCSNCLYYTQTPEHFALKCPLSKTI
ncbi:33865_t:CDS:1, partial [Gigaspora margarita]